MHREVLTKKQAELLSLLELFSNDFGLVGGTAIAFHIGHRRSIDFDLFSNKEFKNEDILDRISKFFKVEMVVVNSPGELTVIVKGVRFTFFRYRHKIDFSKKFEKIIKLPDLLTLAAMKAFTLGMRAKWKDYVDLYFLINKYYRIEDISARTEELFTDMFSAKLFRQQLCFFDDIDYSEEVDFIDGFSVSEETVKTFLIDTATSPF